LFLVLWDHYNNNLVFLKIVFLLAYGIPFFLYSHFHLGTLSQNICHISLFANMKIVINDGLKIEGHNKNYGQATYSRHIRGNSRASKAKTKNKRIGDQEKLTFPRLQQLCCCTCACFSFACAFRMIKLSSPAF